MSTITLYASKINQMPSLINEAKKSVKDYKTELNRLKSKVMKIDSSICNVDDLINSVKTSTETQEDKIESLDKLKDKVNDFISDVVRIDGDAAEAINKSKDNFYDEYYYLKPECEKSNWEKFKDGCKKVGEWCKEHWKAVVTIVIVITAVILVATGVGGILGAMALGALFGAGIGGLSGGIISAATGGSFWDGFESGAFSGAIAGIISGGMGFGLSAGGKAALGLGKTMLIGVVSGSGSSLISDLGDIFIKGENTSVGQILFKTAFTGIFGAAFSGVSYGFSKVLGSWLINSSWLSKSKELFRFGKTANTNYGKITSYTTANPKGISINFSSYNSKSFRIEFDVSRYLHYHFPSLFGSKAHIPLSPIIDSSISRIISNYFLSEE